MEQSLLHWVDNRDVESGIFAVDPEGKQHVSRAVITAWEQAGRLLLGTKGCLSCCSVDGVAHVIVLGNALTIDGAGDGVVTILVTETLAIVHWTAPLLQVNWKSKAVPGSKDKLRLPEVQS